MYKIGSGHLAEHLLLRHQLHRCVFVQLKMIRSRSINNVSYIRVLESLNQLLFHPQLLLNNFQLELLCFPQRIQSRGVFNTLSDVPKLGLHVQKVLSHLFWRAIHWISGNFRDLKSLIERNMIALTSHLFHKRTLGQMSPALMHSTLMLLSRVVAVWCF